MLKILRSNDKADIEALFSRRSMRMSEAEAVVAPILDAVRERGDAALVEYARQFDGVELTEDTLRVSAAEIAEGAAACPTEVREAIAFAAEGKVRPKVSTARLEDVNRVLADLKAGKVNGRVVMVM